MHLIINFINGKLSEKNLTLSRNCNGNENCPSQIPARIRISFCNTYADRFSAVIDPIRESVYALYLYLIGSIFFGLGGYFIESDIIFLLILLILLVFSGDKIKKFSLRDLATLAILTAISVGGRYLFTPIPSVQPSSYIIIMSGLLYSYPGGLVVGILTGVLSNLLMGVGPYMIWQIFLWALMGFIAGFLPKNRKFLTAGYGLFWGYLFGWIMNMKYYTISDTPFNLGTIMVAVGSSFFPYDTFHALTNFALLVFVPYALVVKLKKT